MRTVAPARTAPLVSLTVPTTVALVSVCPKMKGTGNTNRKNANKRAEIFFEIIFISRSVRMCWLHVQMHADQGRAETHKFTLRNNQENAQISGTRNHTRHRDLVGNLKFNADGNGIRSDVVRAIDK